MFFCFMYIDNVIIMSPDNDLMESEGRQCNYRSELFCMAIYFNYVLAFHLRVPS